MRHHLFVTGMPRSGTTLVDKLIALHPQARVFSQPLPLLYVRVKKTFLESRRGRARCPAAALRYPLNDLCGPNYHPPADFLGFLAIFRLDRELCRASLAEMVPFDGQYTKPDDPFRVLDGYRPAALYDFVERYLEALASADGAAADGLRVIGSKEAYCEEYVPYFLSRGGRVVQILRDPRDVLSSLNYGRGAHFGGRRKPDLFNLRLWRKSVAFALAHREEPGFLALRYEDLVRNPPSVAARIADFLVMGRFPPEVFESDLRSQSGEPWLSNSSFRPARRIVADSVGRYRHHLRRETDLFAQALCFAEMNELGYEVEIGVEEVPRILARFRDAEPAERPALAAYAWSRQRRDEEEMRWRSLREGTFEPAWFLFEAAFSRLRRWCAEGSAG